MHLPIRSHLVLVGVCLCTVVNLRAVDSPPSPKSAAAPAVDLAGPNNDPFIKSGNSEDKAANPSQKVPEIMLVEEVYSLKGADALALLEEAGSGTERYQRVTALEQAGKARLTLLTAMVTRSGEASTIESIDEVIYPTEYKPAVPATPLGSPVPTQFEKRNLGQILEVEAIVNEKEGIIDMNITPQQVRLMEWTDCPAWPGDPASRQPRFADKKVSTSLGFALSEPALLGTYTTSEKAHLSPDGVPDMDLVFLRAHLTPLRSVQRPRGFADTPETRLQTMSLQYSFYQLDRSLARELVHLSGPDPEAPWIRLQTLVKADKAKCLQIVNLPTKSGQQATVEEVDEFLYGNQFAAPGIFKTNETTRVQTTPADRDDKEHGGPITRTTTEREQQNPSARGTVTGFEKRNTGMTIQVDPLASPDGTTVNLNQTPQEVSYRGELDNNVFPRRPWFQTRKLSNSLTLATGKHILVSTFNSPVGTGINGQTKDDGQATLLFIRVLPGT